MARTMVQGVPTNHLVQKCARNVVNLAHYAKTRERRLEKIDEGVLAQEKRKCREYYCRKAASC
jgi:hypothetical protein